MCLWVMCIYLLIGTVIFAELEHWNYLDSAYFCVTSLMKIGFGDLVPGTSDQDGSSMHEVKLVVNFVYILLGKDYSIIWILLTFLAASHRPRQL